MRILDKEPSLFPGNAIYIGYPAAHAKEMLLTAFQQYQDLGIISFVSIFERIVLDNLLTIASNCKAGEQDALSRATVEYALRNAERWHFNDILDLHKVLVPADLVGEIKKIYQYRNWVAHEKKTPKPYSIDPKSTYQRLTKFLNEANIALEDLWQLLNYLFALWLCSYCGQVFILTCSPDFLSAVCSWWSLFWLYQEKKASAKCASI